MNYCKNCGTKLKKDSKFCKNCGYDVINNKKTKEKIKKEFNSENILLNIGIILIISSSLLFASITWTNLSDLFKALFMSFEVILFLILAFTSKILKNDSTFKACYFISVLFLPIVLIMINVYKLIPIFNDGAMLYVYLSLISFICLVVYVLSYIFVSKKYIVFTIISFYSFIINILNIFNLNINYIVLVLNITAITFTLINRIIKTDKFNIIINLLLIILFFINIIFSTDINKIIYLSYSIIYIISLYINYYKNESSAINAFVPVLTSIVLAVSLSRVLDKNLFVFFMSLSLLLINLISVNFKVKSNKDMSLIVFIIGYILLSVYANALFKALLIVNIIYFIYSITFILIEKENRLYHLLLSFNIFMIIYSLFNIFSNVSFSLLLLIVSIVLYGIGLIIKDKNISIIYKVFSLILIIFSTIFIGSFKKFNYVVLSNTIVWFIYYLINIKDKKKFIYLIGFILSLIITSYYLKLNYYYIGLSIIILLFATYELLKDDNYLVLGSVFVLLYSLIEIDKIKIYAVVALSLLYFYSYYKINKVNKYKLLKTLLTIFGLLLIYDIIDLFKLPGVISNLIVLFIYINIFIILYLTEREDNKHLLIYSIVFILPYTELIDLLTKGNLNDGLTILYIILYLLIIPFALNKNNTVFYIFNILLSLVLLSSELNILILNLSIAVIFFIYGALLKDAKYIYYSIIYLILSLLVGLYTILNSYILLIILTLIGTGLIIYVIINESKKRVTK